MFPIVADGMRDVRREVLGPLLLGSRVHLFISVGETALRCQDKFPADFMNGVQGWRRWLPNLRFSMGAGNHMTTLKQPYVQDLAALVVT